LSGVVTFGSNETCQPSLLRETSRTFIRRFTLADDQDYFAIFGNPAICRYEDFPPITREEARRDLQEILDHYDTNFGEWEFAVELKAELKVVGVLCYSLRQGAAFIGFHFNQQYQGKGYALEATRAFLSWLAAERVPVAACVDPANRSSIRLLEKLGFRRTGMRSARAGASSAVEVVYTAGAVEG